MSKDPVSVGCPRCGSTESRSRSGLLGPKRVCRICQTRYTRPTPLWERAIFASVFLVLGLVLGTIAGFCFWGAAQPRQDVAVVATAFSFGMTFGVPGIVCIVHSIRELLKRETHSISQLPEGWDRKAFQEEPPEAPAGLPPLVPAEQAEKLVREIAEWHDARGILRSLGAIEDYRLANATARFAREMGPDEIPLALVDTSLMRNGKAGFLLTNRAVYSSFHPRPIWLADIDRVSWQKPGWVGVYVKVVLILLFTGLGGLGPGFRLIGMSANMLILFIWYWSNGLRPPQNKLLVNGEVVYLEGKRLRPAFWIELLEELGNAAREAPSRALSQVTTLETARCSEPGPAAEVVRTPDPGWIAIAQDIRALDGKERPWVRLWTGEPEQGRALEVLGGNGKYALREVPDGWVFYDPGRGEEEVEVCTGGGGYRCPAFYVCTDLGQVLKIARHFYDAGEFE